MKQLHTPLFLILFLLGSLLELHAGPPAVIIIQQPEIPKNAKEAILVLPGLGDSKSGRKHQAERLGQEKYDLYIPDFADKDSYKGSVVKLAKFYQDQELFLYKKLHVFSYILGSWVLNEFILTAQPSNIASIVYDRSPLQERAPSVVADKIPRIGKIYLGQVALDLAEIPYPPIESTDIQMGLLIESKATWFIKLFRKTALSYGTVHWEVDSLLQKHHDFMYIVHNHDEMYEKLDLIDQEILHFFEHGRFSDQAPREPFDWDPFEGPPKK